MGKRVLAFIQAHPLEGDAAATARARLEKTLTRAEELATAQRAGIIADRRATERRLELHKALHFRLLRHLVGAGAIVARDKVELGGEFRLPGLKVAQQTFLTAARAMLAKAESVTEVLLAQGMSPTLLGDLTRAVEEFEQVNQEGLAGRRGHVEARRELEEVGNQLQDEVTFLDSMVRYYFGEDPSVMAGWQSARGIAGPARVRPDISPKPGTIPAEGTTPPSSGGVAPAA